ncbi:MAG: hypothetical protein KBT35_06540 [Firmicutes bacterium]|nr:hypothetical protein [Candidatus Colivicinus equi]
METYKTTDKTSYCLGMSLTIEALLHVPKYIEKIVLSSKANKNNQLEYLIQLCELNSIIPVYDDAIIEKLSIKENCYCIGIFNKFYNTLDSNKHIVLYEFNDFGELGTIFRSAVSFNFHDIVIVNSDIDYFDPRCIRASMGSIFHCNIIRYDNLMDYINDYPEHFIYPFVPNGGHELSELHAFEPYSVIIPQEYRGLCKEFKEGYYIKHKNLNEMSLSSLSSIAFSYLYHQTI